MPADRRLEPIRLEVYADDRCIDTLTADAFRDDLATAGMGNGCHGFFVNLARHGVRRDAVIRVKISNRVLELEDSGKKLSAFPRWSPRRPDGTHQRSDQQQRRTAPDRHRQERRPPPPRV